METQFIDFSSSYIVFRLDTSKVIPKSVSHPPPLSINNVRINHECYATLVEKETDKSESFYLGVRSEVVVAMKLDEIGRASCRERV